jgi:hypothetical protein
VWLAQRPDWNDGLAKMMAAQSKAASGGTGKNDGASMIRQLTGK